MQLHQPKTPAYLMSSLFAQISIPDVPTASTQLCISTTALQTALQIILAAVDRLLGRVL